MCGMALPHDAEAMTTLATSQGTPATTQLGPHGEPARLDVLLALLERRELSATELRFLLAVFQGQATEDQLARVLARTAPEVRRLGDRLRLADVVRRSRREQDSDLTFSITPRGLAIVKPLVTAIQGADR